MKAIVFIIALSLSCTAIGGTKRSASAVREFKKANACPATGLVQKSCRGYVVDHIKPLACNGADKPINMQWQSIADGKSKDKWERKGCK